MKVNAIVPALLFSALMGALQINPALADEKTVTGRVFVSKDEKGNITSVVVSTKAGKKYSIILDDFGKKLGAGFDGKRVTVTGDMEEKDNVRWITLSDVKKADEPGR